MHLPQHFHPFIKIGLLNEILSHFAILVIKQQQSLEKGLTEEAIRSMLRQWLRKLLPNRPPHLHQQLLQGVLFR